jgi:hypothetical protein
MVVFAERVDALGVWLFSLWQYLELPEADCAHSGAGRRAADWGLNCSAEWAPPRPAARPPVLLVRPGPVAGMQSGGATAV